MAMTMMTLMHFLLYIMMAVKEEMSLSLITMNGKGTKSPSDKIARTESPF